MTVVSDMAYEQKKEQRDKFLRAFHSDVDGSLRKNGDQWEIGESLNYDKATTGDIANVLAARGLIKPAGLGGHIRLTELGISAVEDVEKIQPETTSESTISDKIAELLTAITDEGSKNEIEIVSELVLAKIFGSDFKIWVQASVRSAVEASYIGKVPQNNGIEAYKMKPKGKLALEKYKAKHMGVSQASGGDIHVHTIAQGNAQIAILNNSPNAQQSLTMKSNDLSEFWPLIEQLLATVEGLDGSSGSLESALAEIRSLHKLHESGDTNEGVIELLWTSIQNRLIKLGLDLLPALSILLPQISAFFSSGTAT